jgi:hypothetical protein
LSSDKDLIICSAAFVEMSSEARTKTRKRRWWIESLLKQRVGPTLLANLSMEDGSLFRNFTKMRASEFECLATITGFEVSRKDTNYRRSLTVSAITLDAFDFLAS